MINNQLKQFLEQVKYDYDRGLISEEMYNYIVVDHFEQGEEK